VKLAYIIHYVRDVPATLDFYERAFGLSRRFLHESNTYGELETGATALAFVTEEVAASHGFGFTAVRPEGAAPGTEIGLVVEDVGFAYARALGAGAIAMSAPAAKPWGQGVAYVRDPNGFLVELCTAMG